MPKRVGPILVQGAIDLLLLYNRLEYTEYIAAVTKDPNTVLQQAVVVTISYRTA